MMRYLFCAHKCLDSYMNIIVPFFISFGGSFVCWFNMCLNWFCESFIIKMKFQCQTAARTIWIRGKFWAVFVCERFVDQSLYFFFWKLHFLQCDIFTQFKTFIVMFKWFFLLSDIWNKFYSAKELWWYTCIGRCHREVILIYLSIVVKMRVLSHKNVSQSLEHINKSLTFSADVVSLINFYLILALKLYYIGTYYLDEWCCCIDQIITTMNT